MALFKRFFYRKPPDRLLEISDKVFVFDDCFSTDAMEADAYKTYMGAIVPQLQDYCPDSSFMVFNVKEGGDKKTLISDVFSTFGIKVTEYPWQYEGGPLLPLEIVNNFLLACENWQPAAGQKNVVLMHCERGGWPILAFMLAGFCLFTKLYTGELKTLEMIYKQVSRDLVHIWSPLNPQPSQLRYLHYITKRNLGIDWPPEEAPKALDCLILRFLPVLGGKGCRPVIRIYGHDPFSTESNKSCKLLFSSLTSKAKKHPRCYRMDECRLAKIDIHFRVQGDIVLECIHLEDDYVRELLLFRVVFHTAFIRGHVMMLGREEVDLNVDARDPMPKDFKAEVLFVDVEPLPTIVTTDRVSSDGSETSGYDSPDEFFEVEEDEFGDEFEIHDLEVEPTNLLKDNISGFEVEPPSSHDHMSYDANQNLDVKADPSPQLVEEDVDLKNRKVKDNDLKNTIVKDVDLKPKIANEVDLKSKVEILEAKLDSLVQEMKNKKEEFPSSLDVNRVTTYDGFKSVEVPSPPPQPPPTQPLRDGFVFHPTPFLPPLKSTQAPQPPALVLKAPPQVHEASRASPTPPPPTRVAPPPPPPMYEATPPMQVVPPPPPPMQEALAPPSISKAPPPPPPPMQEAPPPPSISKEPPPPPLMQEAPLPPSISKAPPPPPPPIHKVPPPPPPSMQEAPPPPSISKAPPSPIHEVPPPPSSGCLPSPPSISKAPPSTPPSISKAPPPPPPPPPPPMYAAPPPPPPPPMYGAPPPPPMYGAPPPPPPTMYRAPPPPPPPMYGAPPPPPPPMYGAPPPPPPPMYGAPPPPPLPGGAPPPPPLPGGAPPPPPLPRGAPPPPPPPGGAPPPPPPPGGGGPPGPPPPPGAPGPPPPPGAPGPPGGPPPPPGRLGGGPGRGRGRGPAAKKSNLKPLHWNKVTRALQGSLWEELQRQSPPELDVAELETLFSNAAPKKAAPKEADKKKAASNKPEKVQLIDLRRANNTEIMLTKVKMPLPDMVEAVLAMDDELLDVDQVENILKFCPTKEEMDQLKNYTGDLDKLGKCEHFFLELMKVPRMETKLNIFLFKIQFNSQLGDFKKSLNIVNSACDEVRKSVKLKEVMKRILYLGNTLNQGTARGAAVGFKLDSLLKLTDTRASNSRMTLMHYLCKLLANKSPALLEFPDDLLSLEAATKIQLKTLAEEMLSLSNGLKKVKQELEACANDGPVSAGFHTTLKQFIGLAESEVTNVTNFYTVVGKSADGLALYFGEDPARCPFEQATQILCNFVRLFQKCHEENLKQAELERKKAEKEAEMEKAKGGKK